jgi:hypothetical protein
MPRMPSDALQTSPLITAAHSRFMSTKVPFPVSGKTISFDQGELAHLQRRKCNILITDCSQRYAHYSAPKARLLPSEQKGAQWRKYERQRNAVTVS